MNLLRYLTPRVFLMAGALSGALGVALGAAGMHALRPLLTVNDPAGWFSIALQYQQLHAPVLFLSGLALARFPRVVWFAVAGALFVAGTLLFCGNLYLRSLAGFHAWHALTPLGGATLIAGWLALLLGAWRARD